MAAVAFDAVGPSAACQLFATTASGSWTHTAGTGGDTVLVFLTVGLTGASAGALGSFASVTYDGNPMTLLSSVASNGSTWGGIFLYGITSQYHAGARTVAVGTYTPAAGSTFRADPRRVPVVHRGRVDVPVPRRPPCPGAPPPARSGSRAPPWAACAYRRCVRQDRR